MFPPVISDRLIYRFKFWANDAMQDGMRHHHELYRHVAIFSRENRQQAYSLGTDLCQHDAEAVITSSEKGYDVWVSLRSPLQPLPTPLAIPEKMVMSSAMVMPSDSVIAHQIADDRYLATMVGVTSGDCLQNGRAIGVSSLSQLPQFPAQIDADPAKIATLPASWQSPLPPSAVTNYW